MVANADDYFTEAEIDFLLSTHCSCDTPYEGGEPYTCACGITWTWDGPHGYWYATGVNTQLSVDTPITT